MYSFENESCELTGYFHTVEGGWGVGVTMSGFMQAGWEVMAQKCRQMLNHVTEGVDHRETKALNKTFQFLLITTCSRRADEKESRENHDMMRSLMIQIIKEIYCVCERERESLYRGCGSQVCSD